MDYFSQSQHFYLDAVRFPYIRNDATILPYCCPSGKSYSTVNSRRVVKISISLLDNGLERSNGIYEEKDTFANTFIGKVVVAGTVLQIALPVF